MPGCLLHLGAVALCAHAGQAVPMVPNARVKIMGQPVTTQAMPYMIYGCSLTGTTQAPCAIAQWLTGATRVRVMGQPVLLMDSVAACTPTGTGVTVLSTQTRVRGI
jgi:hypothetical protein